MLLQNCTVDADNPLFDGQYEILEELPLGGIARILRARDTRTGRQVAIKVVREALQSNPTVHAYLASEQQCLAALNHPGVVRLAQQVLPAEHGWVPYLVLEWLDGLDLAKVLDQGDALSVADALTIGIKVAQALAAAHDQGIVHRDVKPDNLFLCGTGDSAVEVSAVKLLDFGCALTPATAALNRAHRAAGGIMGTPPYVAPEEGLTNGPGPVDGRADIWSLGVVLYEMIAGLVPFEGPTLAQVYLAMREGPPPIFSNELKRDQHIPPALEAMICWMLAYDREARPCTMREVERLLSDIAASLRT